MHPLAKAIIVFVLVMAFIKFFDVGVRLAFPTLMCYGVYYVIWLSLLRPSIKRQVNPSGAARVAASENGDRSRAADEMSARSARIIKRCFGPRALRRRCGGQTD